MILAHDDSGTGPAVLLIHAGVADRRMWDPVAGALAHVFRVVRPDLRGHGDSPLPGGEYADADDLAALLDHLDVADAVVVGSSFGGRVALELATAHPARVRELVLLNPDHEGIETTAAAETFDDTEDRLLAAGDVEGAVRLNVETWLGPEATESVRAALAVMQRRAFEVQLAADASDDPPRPRSLSVDLDAVAVPTVVVSGAHDMDRFRHAAAHVAAGIRGAELVELDWAGHLPALERPDAVQALLLDVLRDDPTVHAP
ncbi:alpha/beta fold hydrolase [Isoptericola croceus]|uniref:alpha/beta fold hydrolase n=1 Tax=Isoptericola croceus TaxID=3031406 RepID=UPI0023F9ADC8|nr:alpha/beta fold hydrolase [Isoptericola croceus]